MGMISDLADLTDPALLRLGGSTITASGLVAALVVLALTWLAAWVATRALRRVRARAVRAAAAVHILEKLVGYGLIVFGVVAALSVAGLNLSSLAVFAGALGIGVGLGLHEVMEALPGALPSIFTGLRLAMGFALIVIVGTEFLTVSQGGIGALIWQSWTILSVKKMMVGLIITGIMGWLLSLLVSAGERLAMPWRVAD